MKLAKSAISSLRVLRLQGRYVFLSKKTGRAGYSRTPRRYFDQEVSGTSTE